MNVAWVHPSWRDLVIEHLRGNVSARARFLRQTGIHGVLLALSIAGGADGQRALPLLIADADWDALSDRVYELVPQLEDTQQLALLDALTVALAEIHGDPSAELRALATSVLTRLGRLAETRRGFPLPVIEAWLTLARDLEIRPEPAALKHTWGELLPFSPPALDDREALQRFADWLTVADVLHRCSPDTLTRLGFPQSTRSTIDQFLDSVEASINAISTGCLEPVTVAIARIAELQPTLRAIHLAKLLQRSTAEEPARTRPPDRTGAAMTDNFDVERVLTDL